jgi:hypothetical protein
MSTDYEISAAVSKSFAHTQQKSPRLAEGEPEKQLVEGNLSFQLTMF